MFFQYADSGRAKCRNCGMKIERGSVRVGVEAEGDWGPYTRWHHAECFNFRSRQPSSLPGYSALSHEDRQSLAALCAGSPRLGRPAAAAPSWPPRNPQTAPALPSAAAAAAAASSSSPSGFAQAATEPGSPGLTQTSDPEAQRAETEAHFGGVSALVVGIQHYTGVVHNGEYICLVREPSNPYDRNAVRVDNMRGQQVGHIKKEQAAGLAPLMDDRQPLTRLRLEAHITTSGTKWNIPCQIQVYGPQHLAQDFVAYARAKYLQLSLPGVGGGGPGVPSGIGGASVVTSVRQWDRQKSQEELDAMFDSMWDQDASRRAGAPQPPAVLTPLQEHQLQGLSWMLGREAAATGPSASSSSSLSSSQLPPFWEERQEQGRVVFFNTITNSSQPSRPAPVPGGLLADDMGLGKTLHVLALVASNPRPGLQYLPSATPGASDEKGEEAAEGQAEAEAEAPSRAEALRAMKGKELQAEAARVGVPKSGTKAAVVQRILQEEAMRRASPAAAAGAAASAASLFPPDTEDGPRGTLVVSPLSVVFNWEQQVAEHLAPGALKCYTYHGPDRCRDPEFLADQDIVIVTYQTLAAEAAAAGGGDVTPGSKRKHPQQQQLGGVLGLRWRRVVLDEAHYIRNRATATFKACSVVEARFRWCLTGTPMQNKPEDVQALLAFLRCSPLDRFDIFNRAVGRLLRCGDPVGLLRLKVALKAVCLRRTKKGVLKDLPAKTSEIHSIKLAGEHEEQYKVLCDAAQHIITAMGDDAVLESYSSVLECILRLRQACLSSRLIPPARLEAARRVLEQAKRRGPSGGKAQQLTAEEAKKLFEVLQGALQPGDEGPVNQDGGAAECSVCLEAVTGDKARVLRTCRHYFCVPCLDRLLACDLANRCPLCRAAFGPNDMVALTQLEEAAAEADKAKDDGDAKGGPDVKQEETGTNHQEGDAAEAPELPPKVVALLAELRTMREADPRQKAVVFSSFSSFLDVIQSHLCSSGIANFRLDGKMSAKKRKEGLNSFSMYPETCVMLISLKAGGVGLNLTCANHVFLMDLWWNVSAEEQAIDRVHRLGQARPVKVVRYVCEGTIEQRILEIQEQKAVTSQVLMNKTTPEQARSQRLNDIRHMFGA